jgi:hypothetical protein
MFYVWIPMNTRSGFANLIQILYDYFLLIYVKRWNFYKKPQPSQFSYSAFW